MNPEEYAQLFRLGEKHWWFVGTRDLLLASVCRDSLRGRPILDVGCGSALMLKRFADVGPVFGIDHSHAALEHCRSLGFSRVCQADAAALPVKTGAFALVVAADLLEHCQQDEAVLRELNRVTWTGGLLLLSVPAYGSLWSAHDVALHHKRRYSRSELRQKAENAGYRVERTSYFNTFLFPAVALARLLLARPRRDPSEYRIKYHENNRLLNQALLGVLRLERWLLGHCDLPFGLSIVLLASKR